MTLPTMVPGLDRATILEWCRLIDDGPFATLAAGERITYHNQEMFTMLSVAAAVTERVRIMSTVVVLPAHPAVEIAKRAATIDVVSGGRLVLGLGVGGRDADYTALEREPVRRYARLDEQVETMRRVWAGLAPFEGSDPVGPPPVQSGGPPLYAGVFGPKSVARAARWAEGVCGFVFDPVGHDHVGTFAAIEESWHEAGRDTPPRHVTSFWYALGDGAKERLRAYANRYLGIFGEEVADLLAASCSASSVAAVREALEALEESGCDECILVPTSADRAELDLLLEALV